MANVAYRRVSSSQQHLDRQLPGQVFDKEFSDKLSGKNNERPGLTAMMDYVREGDTVHCHELSRLGRSMKDTLEIIDSLKAQGVSIQFHKEGLTVTPDGNAMGNMFVHVLLTVAQMERELLLERQAEGYAAAKAAGRCVARGKSAKVDRAGIAAALDAGQSIRAIARDFGVSPQTVQAVKKEQVL